MVTIGTRRDTEDTRRLKRRAELWAAAEFGIYTDVGLEVVPPVFGNRSGVTQIICVQPLDERQAHRVRGLLFHNATDVLGEESALRPGPGPVRGREKMDTSPDDVSIS